MPVFEIGLIIMLTVFTLFMIGYMIWDYKEEQKFLDMYYHTMYGGYDDYDSWL